MRNIVVINFISLDGVIQAPLRADEDLDGGFVNGGWVQPYMDDKVAEFMGRSTSDASGMLLGRRTYQNFVRDWKQVNPTDPAIAAMNRMPKYLVSRALPDPAWRNTVRLGPDLPAEANRLRSEGHGEVVVFGSAQLIRALQQHDLVDEYRLLIFPLLLGRGKRMFDEAVALTRFELSSSMLSSSGVTINCYRRTRSD
ncbi:MAG: dihydrofolate reductase family protein [Microlunatus sp.]|nr:dihydrofolate reductase family protein [Microlunatus sp.]